MPGIARIPTYRMPTAGEVPAPVAGWRADPRRAVLLLHDLQEYFLRPFGEPVRRELLANAALLRDRCAELGVPVAYTAQPGSMTSAQRGLLADFWGPGMRVAAGDRAVAAPVAPAPGDWQLTKWRYSAFFRTDLLARLRAAGRDQLVICGVYAHLGVLVSATEAFSNDIETFLVADAVADFTAEHHRLALRTAAASCAVVRTTGQLVTELTGLAAGAAR